MRQDKFILDSCDRAAGKQSEILVEIYVDVNCEPDTLESAMSGINGGTKETGTLIGVLAGTGIGIVGNIGLGSVSCLKISDEWNRAWQ